MWVLPRALGRRRRNQARCRALLVAAALGLSAVLTGARTQAQGWAVDRVEPAPAGDLFFQTHFPVFATDRPATLFFGLTNAYSYEPLVATVGVGASAQTLPAIEHLFATHVQVNAHLAGRLGLDVSIPVYWVQTGTNDPSVAVRAMSGVNVGDVRLGARLRIVGYADRDAASLHLAVTGRFGFLQPAETPQTTSDASFRGRLFAVGAGTVGIFRWSLSTGVQLRPGADAPNVHVGSEMFALAGAGVSLVSNRLFLGAEGEFATDLLSPFEAGTNHVQLWAIARLGLLNDALRIGVGAGPGLSQAPGTPAFGAFLTLAYALPLGASIAAVVRDPSREIETDSHTASHASTPSRATDGTAIESVVQSPPTRGEVTSSSATASAMPPSAAPTDVQGASTSPELPTSSSSPPPPADSFCSVPSDQSCAINDTDGDGILEPLDQCPTVPAGRHPDPARPGCPDSDTDGDGVFDSVDVCPNAPAGTAPDPERRGCPLPDADGDHIPDAVDHCPAIPGAPHPDPTLNGCPGLVRLQANAVEILQPILFAPNRAAIQARSRPVMQAVANALSARTDIRYMLIEGHTDDAGNAELNVDLSQRRAAAVVRWLVDHGISPARLQSRGMGSLAPRVPVRPGMPRRALREARLRNRRVEFEILEDPHATSSSAPVASPTSSAPVAGPSTTAPGGVR